MQAHLTIGEILKIYESERDITLNNLQKKPEFLLLLVPMNLMKQGKSDIVIFSGWQNVMIYQ